MNSITRGFSTATWTAIKWGGTTTLTDVRKLNVGNGEQFHDGVVNMAEAMEKDVSRRNSSQKNGRWRFPDPKDRGGQNPVCLLQLYWCSFASSNHIGADQIRRGAKAHKSAKDPSDERKVITVGFYSSGGTRLASGHAHEDGTFKYWLSRTGKDWVETKKDQEKDEREIGENLGSVETSWSNGSTTPDWPDVTLGDIPFNQTMKWLICPAAETYLVVYYLIAPFFATSLARYLPERPWTPDSRQCCCHWRN